MSAYLIYDVDIPDPEPYGEFLKQIKALRRTCSTGHVVIVDGV